MATHKITNLGTPTLTADAATKGYVDSNAGITQTNADARYYLNTVALNSITAPTANLSLNSFKITNLATPTLTGDAATKGYVDSNGGLSKATADTYYFSFANTTLPSASLNMNS